MEPDGRPLQPDLFGPEEMEADFAAVLCGLIAIEGLGRQGISALTDALSGKLGRLWDMPPEALLEVLLKARVPKAQRVIQHVQERDQVLANGIEDLERLNATGVHVMAPNELPHALRQIPTPPRWLFVQGDPSVLYRRPAVAVVGTREATTEGLVATRRVVQLLEGYPITVVSGLAEGIDDEAHRASIWSRLTNVAFLGHGIDIVFPQSTKGTRARILDQGGAIATEYLPGETYQRSYFVQRNRLQAGLADLVIAVEAQAKSGTAHTVDFALKYKKRVVGIRMPHSTITNTIEQAGQLVVDLTTPQGHKNLDELLNRIVTHSGHKPDPFAANIDRLKRDLKIRNMTPSALEKLAATLYNVVLDELNRVKAEAKGDLP